MADTVSVDKTLTNQWQKIAEDTEFFMASISRKSPIAIAFVGVDAEPTASGHTLDPDDFDSRGFVRNQGGPPGFAYARTLEAGATFDLNMSIWTPE